MRNQQSTLSSQKPEIRGRKSGLFKSLNAEGKMLTAIVLNEKGIALMMVLVLSAILLAIMAGMIYMVISGTQISGIEKRYKTALEASYGGEAEILQFIGDRGISNLPVPCIKCPPEPCLTDKLTKATKDWNQACSSSITINPLDATTYDISFTLGSYTIYSKIVDTIVGNSGPDEGLLKTGVVQPNTGEIKPITVPYLYTIEVHAQNTDNQNERAKLSILYLY